MKRRSVKMGPEQNRDAKLAQQLPDGVIPTMEVCGLRFRSKSDSSTTCDRDSSDTFIVMNA